MPTYPSRLRLEPFIEVIQTPDTDVAPNHRTIQSVQSYPNSVAVAFGFNLFFVYFQTLWDIQIILRVVLYWTDYEVSSTPSSPSPPPAQIPPPAGQEESDRSSDNDSKESHQSQGSDRSQGTGHTFGSYHEARIATPAQSEASLDQPPDEPEEAILPSSDDSFPMGVVTPPILLSQRRSNTPQWMVECRAATLSYTPPRVSTPDGLEHQVETSRPSSLHSSASSDGSAESEPLFSFIDAPRWTIKMYDRTELRQQLPPALALDPEYAPRVRMMFLQPLSWTQFRNLLSSSAIHYSGHPTFLDFLENNLIDYIVHQKALPKVTRIHHWYELISMTKWI